MGENATNVGRIFMTFVGGCFGLEIWHTYNQLKDNALVKALWDNTNF
jgi:hypothetical protein